MDPCKTHASKSEKRENEASSSKKRLEPEYPEKKRKGSQDRSEYDITKDNGFQYQKRERENANLYYRSSGYFDVNETRIESAAIEVNTRHSDLTEKEMFPLKLIAYTKPFKKIELAGTFSAKVQLKNDYLRQIGQKHITRAEDETRPIFVVSLNMDPNKKDEDFESTIETFYRHITKKRNMSLEDKEHNSTRSEYLTAMFFETFINSFVKKTEIEFGNVNEQIPDFILNIFGLSCFTEITRVSYLFKEKKITQLLEDKLKKFKDKNHPLILLCVLCSSEEYTIEALKAYDMVDEKYKGSKENPRTIVMFFFDIRKGSFMF